jgi:hypothetical protein
MVDQEKSGWRGFWGAITFGSILRILLLLILAGIAYSIWTEGIGSVITALGQWFDHAGEVNFARGLMTFLIVAATISIAIVLVAFGLYSRDGDPEFWKLRFSLSKDVLTAFMGILGTIMGFYYAEDRVSTASIPTLNQAAKQTPIAELEKDGFTALLGKDFTHASQAFGDAYKLNSSYHNVGDINQLLSERKDRFNTAAKDPKQADQIWTEVFCAIAQRKLTVGMSDEMIGQIRKDCPSYDPGANTAIVGIANPTVGNSSTNSNLAANK